MMQAYSWTSQRVPEKHEKKLQIKIVLFFYRQFAECLTFEGLLQNFLSFIPSKSSENLIPLLPKPNAKLMLPPMGGQSVANLLEVLVYHSQPADITQVQKSRKSAQKKNSGCKRKVIVTFEIPVSSLT